MVEQSRFVVFKTKQLPSPAGKKRNTKTVPFPLGSHRLPRGVPGVDGEADDKSIRERRKSIVGYWMRSEDGGNWITERIQIVCCRTLTMVTHPFINPVQQDLTSTNKQC